MRLLSYAELAVTKQASEAPEPAHNESAIRLSGYLFDHLRRTWFGLRERAEEQRGGGDPATLPRPPGRECCRCRCPWEWRRLMPLDRRIELRIFDAISQVPRGSPATVATVWAGPAGRKRRADTGSLASTGGTLFVDYRIRWRADVEAIIPGLLIVRDEAGNDYEVSGVATAIKGEVT